MAAEEFFPSEPFVVTFVCIVIRSLLCMLQRKERKKVSSKRTKGESEWSGRPPMKHRGIFVIGCVFVCLILICFELMSRAALNYGSTSMHQSAPAKQPRRHF